MKLYCESVNIAVETDAMASRKPYISRHRKQNSWRVVKSTFNACL